MSEQKVANLALQGGGTHGAFTWGALQRLLEEPRFQIDGVSATSAGAMNAVILAHGLTLGGRDGAMSALASFWQQVASLATKSFLQPPLYDRITGNEGLEHSPSYMFFDMLSRVFSPYQINPFNYNPLRSLLEDGRFRAPASRMRRQAVSVRHQCAHRQGARLHQRGNQRDPRARLGLSAVSVLGSGDRRRVFLGWWLYGQSCALSADLRLSVARHCRCSCPHDGTARNPEDGAGDHKPCQ